MGIVYKARDIHLDRFVAIKVLPHELVADPDRKRRFVQEARAASALNHPNIITIHDIASEDSRDFMVMEYLEGKTLDRLIPRRGMKPNEALKIAIQMADGLAKAHGAGIIHRDLKPGNIMVNEGGMVKLLDFGLAKLTEKTQVGEPNATDILQPQTEEGMILGTASYMSPEQAEGRPVDARSDIFSFGSILYEMVTGKRAFQGDSKLSTLAMILNQEPKSAGEIARTLPHDPTAGFSTTIRDGRTIIASGGFQPTEVPKLRSSSPSVPRGAGWWWTMGSISSPDLTRPVFLISGSKTSPTARCVQSLQSKARSILA
jgi:serine/threonine protein kinase